MHIRLFFLILLFYFHDYVFSQSEIDKQIAASIIPIIKVGPRVGPERWVLKYPVGTAFLVKDSVKNSNRLFLITSRHIIEEDTITILLINLTSQKNDKSEVTSVRKYLIKKDEWKYHPADSIGKGSKYTGYDIAIAEIFILRISLSEQKLWHKPLEIKWFINTSISKYTEEKIYAFPFVDKFNLDRGITMGDLEMERGTLYNFKNTIVSFDKSRLVKDLGQILIKNPKYRPGYSGGVVFNTDNGIHILGMAMGMTDIRKLGTDRYCLAFFVKSENILETLRYNFYR